MAIGCGERGLGHLSEGVKPALVDVNTLTWLQDEHTWAIA
jgi:hypothetical protein